MTDNRFRQFAGTSRQRRLTPPSGTGSARRPALCMNIHKPALKPPKGCVPSRRGYLEPAGPGRCDSNRTGWAFVNPTSERSRRHVRISINQNSPTRRTETDTFGFYRHPNPGKGRWNSRPLMSKMEIRVLLENCRKGDRRGDCIRWNFIRPSGGTRRRLLRNTDANDRSSSFGTNNGASPEPNQRPLLPKLSASGTSAKPFRHHRVKTGTIPATASSPQADRHISTRIRDVDSNWKRPHHRKRG